MNHAAQQMALCRPGVKALPSSQDLKLAANIALPDTEGTQTQSWCLWVEGGPGSIQT